MKAVAWMRCVDVNVLVYAHRPEPSAHDTFLEWLEAARVGPEPLGVPNLVASGFLRVVTHPRIFREPTPLPIAMAFIEGLRASAASVPVEPGPRHWELFTGFCDSLSLRGNDIADAYLAALALEQGGVWVSADRGFARFPGVRLEVPA
jgi:toxin-antitoxin system PIN domain toxin